MRKSPKPEPDFPTLVVVIFLRVFIELRWGVIVGFVYIVIDGIVDLLCLNLKCWIPGRY